MKMIKTFLAGAAIIAGLGLAGAVASGKGGAKMVSPIGRTAGQRRVEVIKQQEGFRPRFPAGGEIFQEDHRWTATIPAEKKLVIMATGDVIPARMTNYRAAVELKDFLWPWKMTAEVLRQADVTVIDLEAPIFEGCPAIKQPTFTFCGEKGHVDGLVYAGVDAATLANNHTGNFGHEGIVKTEEALQAAGITPFGISGPAYREFKGRKLAFLGYSDVGARIDLTRMAEAIGEARKKSDIIIVEFHWGEEYVTAPDARQREIAHRAIDSGADLIIGNHPHWIKPVELYKNRLIAYGHGNFIFDQEWSKKTKEGVVGRYTFYEDQLVDAEFLPILIEDYGQPYFLTGAEKERILTEMKQASEALSASKRQ